MYYATDEELLHIMEQEQRNQPDQDDQDGGYDDGVAHSGHYTH